MKFIYSILITLVLTSCATVDTSYKGADAGYAVISLTMDDDNSLWPKANFNSFEMDFVSDDNKTEGYQSFYSSKDGFGRPDADIQDKDSETFVIVRSLQPGKYRMYSFLLKNNGNNTLSVWNKKPFSIPFEIKANEYSYLGNYHGIATTKKALLFGDAVKGAYIVVSDYQDRDVKLAKIANPSMKIDAISSAVPVVELISNPLFVRERITN